MSTPSDSPAGTPPDPLLGQVLHETYVIEKLLGAGGMGAVYKARHLRLGKKYFAVKVLHAAMAANADVFGRFRNEAEITSRLQHPHIVQVVDFNQIAGGAYYLVMELLSGEDLAGRLARVGRLSLPEALSVVHQVGSALQAAHDSGVVHRDLKPQNIFLVRNNELGKAVDLVKVVDFGISKIRHPDMGSGGPATTDGTLLGTPSYMSPEQASGRIKEIDGRTDQYALSAIVYEMLSGRLAFMPEGDEGLTGVLIRVITQPAPPLHLLCPDLPPQVVNAVVRAMSKNPAERFPSVMEFLRALGALEAGHGQVEVRGAGAGGGTNPAPGTFQSGPPLGMGTAQGMSSHAGPGGMLSSGLMAQGPSGLLGGPTLTPGNAADLFAGTRGHRAAGAAGTAAAGAATQVLPGGGTPEAATQVLPSGAVVSTPGATPAAAQGTALLPAGGAGQGAQAGQAALATVAIGSQTVVPQYGGGIRAGAEVSGGGMAKVLVYGAVAGVGGLLLLLFLLAKVFGH